MARGGGIVLAQAPTDYRLGKVVQILENNTSNQNSLVDCNHPPCILRPSCMLKSALDQAVQAFFDYLDQYTLADAIRQPVQHAISKENRIQILDLMAENLPIKAG